MYGTTTPPDMPSASSPHSVRFAERPIISASSPSSIYEDEVDEMSTNAGTSRARVSQQEPTTAEPEGVSIEVVEVDENGAAETSAPARETVEEEEKQAGCFTALCGALGKLSPTKKKEGKAAKARKLGGHGTGTAGATPLIVIHMQPESAAEARIRLEELENSRPSSPVAPAVFHIGPRTGSRVSPRSEVHQSELKTEALDKGLRPSATPRRRSSPPPKCPHLDPDREADDTIDSIDELTI
ncbi:hypothetical protein BU16DRAFT_541882 [Lophium mytilinum]|uniref:Uncharacterized protein n=1 Tax=Lophium mytilinum TaxID=390894 RepID=A0A6A6QKK8_9PEZI|nr:hypothetical protein BU16DRAFT_541882 [Lophium mytilinum]